MTDDPKPTGAPAGDPKATNPVSRFWEWVKQRNEEERRQDRERLAAVGRGITGAAIETVQTIAEGGAFISRKTGLGEAIEPGFNAAYDDSGGARGLTKDVLAEERGARDYYLGRRSDDKVAGFIEDATQFMTSYVALGQVRTVAGGTKLAKAGYLTSAMVRGAVADATSLDPYEAQLAEFAARTDIPGLSELGDLLSVNADDAAITARLKRSAAGAILGTTLDGLIWTARSIRGAKRIASGKLSPEELAATEREMAEAAQVLEAIQQGTSTPAAPIVVRPDANGNYRLIAREDLPQPAVVGISKKVYTGDDAIDLAYNAGDPPVHEGYVLRNGELVADQMQAEAKAAGDGPVFTSRAEAEAQAQSMNRALETPDPLPAAEEILREMKGAMDASGQISDEVIDDLADRILSRADLTQTTELLTELSKNAEIQSVVNRMARSHSTNLGRRIATLDILLENRPHDPVVREEAVKRVTELLNFEDYRKWIVGEQGRGLRQEGRRVPKQAKASADPSSPPKSEKAQSGSQKKQTESVAGMETRDAGRNAVDAANIRQVTRMFRLAGGSPADVTAAIQATQAVQRTGNIDKVLEVFTNFILSNPVTAKTIALSGQSVSAFEAFGRILGGLGTGNKALTQEGADILYGLYSHLKENAKVARMALNEGQSIINPAPSYHAIGGTTGELIRAPGAVALAADEFTRVTNYRAFVRAKSLRQGRAMGLKGDVLEAHVQKDLASAFDPETGIATIPEALLYAERSTLSGPLGLETFGGKFAKLVRETPALQFLSPFIKAGTNIFRFTTMHTPLLSRLNAEARAIMEAGGEEAAVLQAKQAMAAGIYTTATLMAANGMMTGKAPSDPTLRALWLKDNQEYSVRIGGKWVSYRRTDPFGIMMGLAADYVQFAAQMDEADPDLEQLAFAMVASLGTSVLTPTYMRGWGDFISVMDSGDAKEWEKWVQGYAKSFVPNVLNAVNTDEYFRETRGFADAIASKVPGWSQTLDPRYDIFGEPIANTGVANRSAVFKTRDVSASAETEIMKLGHGFASFPQKTPNGVDLTDRKTFDNGTGISPWNRLMELVREPRGGGESLRTRIDKLIQSEKYQNASPGTMDYPGGERWNLIARERMRAYTKALRQVMSEYPKLLEEDRRARHLQRGALRGGEEGLLRAEEIFGELQQSRPIPRNRLLQR